MPRPRWRPANSTTRTIPEPTAPSAWSATPPASVTRSRRLVLPGVGVPVGGCGGFVHAPDAGRDPEYAPDGHEGRVRPEPGIQKAASEGADQGAGHQGDGGHQRPSERPRPGTVALITPGD